MKCSENVDNGPRNSSLNFDDVLDSGATLTFGLNCHSSTVNIKQPNVM